MDLKERFERGRNSHTYIRIDSSYKVDVFLGYSDTGQMSMVITEIGKQYHVESSKVVKVELKTRTDGKKALSFDLQDEAYQQEFFVFCKDIIWACEKAGPGNAIYAGITRWKYWCELFRKGNKTGLEKNRAKGLLGEMLFLKEYAFREFGIRASLESWMGPLLGHKDYEIGDTWYEIKTVNENSNQVNISSLEQLASEITGHLVIIRLEETSKVNDAAIDLNGVIEDIYSVLLDDDDRDLFDAKLALAGFGSECDCTEWFYKYKGHDFYLVNSLFPCLRTTNVPSAVTSAKYTISLNGITDFKELI